MNKLKKPCSIVHIVIVVLLSLFSLSIGISLLVLSHHDPDLLPISTLQITIYMFIYGIIMFFLGILTIIATYKEKIVILQIYEIICLIGFIFFGLLFAIIIFGSTGNQGTNNQQGCYSAGNYFEFKMIEIHAKAQTLYCTEKCPCNGPESFSQVQSCPGWTYDPFQVILEKMEVNFECSGWCQINKNSYYLFNQINEQLIVPEQKIDCYNAWKNWLKQQQHIIIGFFTTQTSLLFLAILFTNLRILDLEDDIV